MILDNIQPWLFSKEEDNICIMPDFSRSLPVADHDHCELFISLGCATETPHALNITQEYLSITHFETDERFLVSGSRAENHPWTVYIWNYKEFNGVKIPSEFKLTWHLPEGPYDYIKATMNNLDFNINGL